MSGKLKEDLKHLSTPSYCEFKQLWNPGYIDARQTVAPGHPFINYNDKEIRKKENTVLMDPTSPFSSGFSRFFMGYQFPN